MSDLAVHRRRTAVAVMLLCMLVLPVCSRAQNTDRAERIVVGATIYTVDPGAPIAEALAIGDGRIVGVGEEEQIRRRFEGPETVIEALDGGAVYPGFIDAHGHVLNLGRELRTVDLFGTGSAADVAARVEAAAGRLPADAWIEGRGWDQNDWARKTFPTRAVLDALPGVTQPVFLRRIDGHAAWVNGRALEMAGVNAETRDPEGGRIVRDENGEPTGVLVDEAMRLVERSIPAPDEAELEARIAAAQARIVAFGLTGVHSMAEDRREAAALARWAAAGRLEPRVVVYLDGADPGLLDWWRTEGRATLTPTPVFRVAGVKRLADGALGSRGGALLAPYSDDPGNEGLLIISPSAITALATEVLGLGLQPAIHAIGDRGNRIALDALAAAMSSHPGTGVNTRIEHAQVVAPDDIARFAALGVVASVQPTHATSDMYWVEDRLGPERIAGAYAWRTLLDAGVTLVCGSDFPVESVNPLHGFYAAVSRQDLSGWPDGGWRPSERMTRDEALACYTRDPARVVGMENEVGRLAVGLRADYVVLDRDIMEVPLAEIPDATVRQTVIGGVRVYAAPSPKSASGE